MTKINFNPNNFNPKPLLPIVHYVYIFQDGCVMALDKDFIQVPSYQGHRDDVMSRIENDFPAVTIQRDCEWKNGEVKVKKENK